MIQLLALRTFVPKDSQEEKTYDKLLDTGMEIQSVPWLLRHLDKVLENIPPDMRWNIFYTVANCKDGKREFDSSDIIPFDIDGVSEKYLDSYAAVVCSSLGIDQSKTALVSSGNGIHILVQTTHTVRDPKWFKQNRHHYKSVCEKINAALEAAGLPGKADPAVFEARRILRLPGTVNRKPDKPEKPCLLIQPSITPQSFDLAELSGIPVVPKDEQVPGSLMRKYPKTDTAAVLNGCQFLNWGKENPAAMSEPEWHAAISILARLDGEAEKGHPVAHSFSQGHPSYSREETDAKIESSLAAGGPRTCSAIEGYGKCSGCPHRGKVASPILIRGAGVIPTEDTGFHTVIVPKNGEPKYIPNYEDLIKFFEREHQFKSLGPSRQVYVWKGTHYVHVEKAELEAFAREHFDPKPSAKMMDEFRRRTEVANNVPVEWWENTTKRKMNFLNGYLDIDSMEFRPHTPDVAFRTVLPYEYDPTAAAPLFSAMLKKVTGNDEDMEKVLEEFMGYCLSGDTCWAQKALVLTGEGSNGKSTFLEVLTAMAGEDNYATVNLAKIDESYNLSLLDKKLFNISEETPPEALGKSHTFKNLVVGGRIQVRVPFKAPYHIANTAKLVLTCNELPGTPDSTQGFYRRLLIVPFTQVFEKGQDDYDPRLGAKLMKELPGILNIALAGYRRALAAGGFTESKRINESLAEYRMENDSVLYWAKERLIIHPDDPAEEKFIAIADLYQDYRTATMAQAIIPVNANKFRKRLQLMKADVWGAVPYGKRATRKYIEVQGKTVRVRGLTGVEMPPISYM